MIVLVTVGTLFATHLVGAVLHELAHALAAALMGLGVKEVQLGGGPVLFRTGLSRTAIEIRLLPGRGMVQHLRPAERWRRLRMFIFFAAGPACDILVFLALLTASRQPHATEHLSTALAIAAGAQAYCIFSNLWPHTTVVNDVRVANDGLQLVRLLTRKDGSAVHQTGQEAIYQGVYEVLIKQYLLPGQSLPTRSERSAGALDYIVARYVNREGETPEMVSQMETILSTDLQPCEELLLLDALITAILPLGDPERLADLDRWSARAYELGSDIATIRASRGSVLIEIDRPEEGLALLEDGLNGQEFNDCLVHAFRALGHFKLGDSARTEGEFARLKALFRHEQWHGQDIARIVERIGKTIGHELKLPTTWSVEAAKAAFRTQTSGRPEPQDTR